MKVEFPQKPDSFKAAWPDEFTLFSWQDFLTAIPSPIFVVTSWKANGKENACLASWSTFVGDKGEFICILGAVSRVRGHLYPTLKETGCCVLNFPSRDVYDKCAATIKNNGFDDDEITKSGLTAEKAVAVNAPRIKECFLNIECEYLWEHEHFPNSYDTIIALRAKHICMDTAKTNEHGAGRYGKTGYMYNIHSPRNAQTGEVTPDCFGALEKYS
jgi:flavin reductase (DIM6/NTAB) family NADH-FMN oxidoreductase RutF